MVILKRKPEKNSQETCICSKKKTKALMIQCKNDKCSSPWWHASCAGLKGNTEEKLKALTFICPLCSISKISANEKLVVESQGDQCSKTEVSAEQGKSSMVDLKESIVRELKEFLPTLLKESITNNMSNENSKPKVRHRLVLTPKCADNDKETFTASSWAEVAKDLPKQLNNLPVLNSKLTESGLGLLDFPSDKSRDKAKGNLDGKYNIKVEDKNIKTVYPKIKISGLIRENFSEDNTKAITELREEIFNKNEGLKELVINDKKVFEVLFINKKQEQKYSFAVVKVEPIVKELIKKNGNKLFIGLSACRVSERVHLLQCYTCQQFGHKVGSTKCPLKDKEISVCLYCSDNHLSRDCPIKKSKDTTKYKCANCCKSSNQNIAQGAMGHTTTSQECPIFQKELKSTLSRTMGMSSHTELSKNAIVT